MSRTGIRSIRAFLIPKNSVSKNSAASQAISLSQIDLGNFLAGPARTRAHTRTREHSRSFATAVEKGSGCSIVPIGYLTAVSQPGGA